MNKAVCFIVSVIFLSSTSLADDLEKYKYCHAKYQNLNARQMHIDRLSRTVNYHQKAFIKYRNFKDDNLANFHKQHHNYLHQILYQQKEHLKKQRQIYKDECKSQTIPASTPMNHEHYQIISPI